MARYLAIRKAERRWGLRCLYAFGAVLAVGLVIAGIVVSIKLEMRV